MLIHSASQLLTLSGGPQRGHALGTLGIIENGAVVVRDEKIVAVGTTDELKHAYPDEPTLDAGALRAYARLCRSAYACHLGR